ncbi:MAG: dTDP-glucose 4,6-dehydratase [Candidatus Heimdallarchaeaceae archaeon]
MLLVTGIAGFIGSNFLYYFLEKYKKQKIIGLDKLTYAGNLANLSKLTKEERERFIFIKGDINDSHLLNEIFNKYEITGIINFAAETHVDRSIENPQIFLKTNILGTQSLLEVSKKYWLINDTWKEQVKFLQISTDEVYGSLGPKGFFTEESNLAPNSPYSASKAAADLIVRAYHKTYSMPVNITRCSNNYGKYQFPEKLIPLMINKALRHQKLPVYGDGLHVRDWLFVEDHCKAIDLVYRKGRVGEVYNIGGKNEIRNIDLVRKIIDYLKLKTNDDKINETLIKHVKDRLGHDRRYGIDPSKIEKELGWEPRTDFEQGIRKTIDWYLENIDWLKKISSKEYIKANKLFK